MNAVRRRRRGQFRTGKAREGSGSDPLPTDENAAGAVRERGTAKQASVNKVLRPSLTGQLFIANVVLLTLAVVVTASMWTVHNYWELEHQYERRALAVARSVATVPAIQQALASAEDPEPRVAPLAERLRVSSDARYVVVMDTAGIRYSHPDPDEIGRRAANDPSPASEGQAWTGTQFGPAGWTLRAKVPVRSSTSEDSNVIGVVSVGIAVSEIEGAAVRAASVAAGAAVVVLVGGALGAWVISRRVRAKTHGLEPREITQLLEHREALLHAIREGVLAVNAEGEVELANQPARDMLGLDAHCVGRSLATLGLESGIHDILSGARSGNDQMAMVGSRILVCNRRDTGDGRAVVTMRDHTELMRLSDELDGARTVTRGLRAQSHEFANRIHTVAGMLDLGSVEQARSYLTELSPSHDRAGSEITGRINDVALAALVMAKSAQASERGLRLDLAPVTRIPDELSADVREEVLLVVGNLLDNALEAAGTDGWVELLLLAHEGPQTPPLLEARVSDSGPGIADAVVDDLFTAGTSTKLASTASGDDRSHRGMGLALVRHACARRGGWITVDTDGETAFTAYVPLAAAPLDDKTNALGSSEDTWEGGEA